MDQSMSKKKTAEESPPLELAMSELEQIVRRLEQGGGTLDEDLAGYARATELIKLCHGRLSEAEKTIQLLSGVDAEGNPITEPFTSSEAATLEQKQADRSRRRTAQQDDSLF
jgi:exodeoxyribonuclease VII small subunit